MITYTFIQVLSADGTQEVGKISKQWGGLAKEYFTDADNFGIQCELALLTSISRLTVPSFDVCSSYGS